MGKIRSVAVAPQTESATGCSGTQRSQGVGSSVDRQWLPVIEQSAVVLCLQWACGTAIVVSGCHRRPGGPHSAILSIRLVCVFKSHLLRALYADGNCHRMKLSLHWSSLMKVLFCRNVSVEARLYGEVVGDFSLPAVAPISASCQLPAASNRQHLPLRHGPRQDCVFPRKHHLQSHISSSQPAIIRSLSRLPVQILLAAFRIVFAFKTFYILRQGSYLAASKHPQPKVHSTAFALGHFSFSRAERRLIEYPKTQINVRGFTKQPSSTFVTVPWFMLYLGRAGH